MKPYAENKSAIKRRLNFQMSKIIDISSFYETNCCGKIFCSRKIFRIQLQFFSVINFAKQNIPISLFMLSGKNIYILFLYINKQIKYLYVTVIIEIGDKRYKFFWRLFQYKNGSLINYQKYDNMNDEFGDSKFSGCLFMKNTNEFIVWYYEKEIKFCRIEQNQKWKTIQVIQKIPVSYVALSPDEQTLFVCQKNLSLYKKSQQQTRNQIWVCFFQVSLPLFADRFFIDQACNTFIATDIYNFWIVKNYKNLKIRKLLKCSRIYSFFVLGLFEDQFIVTQYFIIKSLFYIQNLNQVTIQWNKQTRKILRKYKPKIGNQEITLLSYNQESRFNLAYLNKQLIFWVFQNGKIRPLQILEDQFSLDKAQIGNNGQLVIKYGYGTSSPIVFYESAQ